ncbi:MAG: hypothetical protein KAR65_10005 [Anaerolineales bacterium]|nr:hypothetical protein [Anaerolineales bacterium]
MMKNKTLVLALFILLLSACVNSADPTLLPDPYDDNVDPAEPSATMPDTEVPVIEAPDNQENIVTDGSVILGDAETFVELAITDLAQRVGVEISAIMLVSNKEVVWPDATLGCPKPGMDFSPVEIPGFIITLEVDGKRYEYHTDNVNRVILCPAEGERPDEIFIMP